MATKKQSARPEQQLTELVAKLLRIWPLEREACIEALACEGAEPTSNELGICPAFLFKGAMPQPVSAAKFFDEGSRSEVHLVLKPGMELKRLRAALEGARVVSARTYKKGTYAVPKFGEVVFIHTFEVSQLRIRSEPAKGPDGRKRFLPDGFVASGYTFKHGRRVRIDSVAGTIKPNESGHPLELIATASVGTLVSNEGFVARVRWDAQSWTTGVRESGRWTVRGHVRLGEFETTIHSDYLRPL